MAKIGRNEKCPCQSGKKFKKCCGSKPRQTTRPMTEEEKLKITLMGAVEQISDAAMKKVAAIKELGVFVLYSTENGDAWLFELTECDCVQLVKHGKHLTPPINENPETIEIDWAYSFEVKDKKMILTDYADKTVSELVDAPTKEISATRRRILKKFSAQQLKEVHLSAEKIEAA